MLGTWMLPDLKTAEDKASDYFTDAVTVECQCGLIYLSGSGRVGDDPLLSAHYDPETGVLDECEVCRAK